MKNQKAVEYLNKLDNDIEELIDSSTPPDGHEIGVIKKRGRDGEIDLIIELWDKTITKEELERSIKALRLQLDNHVDELWRFNMREFRARTKSENKTVG